jgi:ubiquinone/menaquinone biosynthesis C-methylase UbiE
MLFLSMVYHHIANLHRAHAEFWRVLKRGKYLCIRNSITDLLEQTLYLQYFPGAKMLNEQRLLSKADLIAGLEQQGFSLATYRVISQLFANNLAEYVAKVGQRSLSDLVLISDQGFADGMRAMEQDVSEYDDAIFEPIALFVFQKV